jgi:hypothetical protein
MTITLNSPSTGNYQVGKGVVSFKQDGDTEYRDLGNVSALSISADIETLDHFSSRAGVKSKDLSIILSKGGTLNMTMDEVTARNLALMVAGVVDEEAIGGPTIEIFGQNAINGALKFVGANEIGPKVNLDLPNVSFKPDGDLDFISDEWNELEVTGEVLQATTGDLAGKFGMMQITNIEAAS